MNRPIRNVSFGLSDEKNGQNVQRDKSSMGDLNEKFKPLNLSTNKTRNTSVYIPAGMKLNNIPDKPKLQRSKSFRFDNSDVSCASPEKKCQTMQRSKSFVRDSHADDQWDYSDKVSSNTHISPPKTICKNRSIPIETYSFRVNENSGFHSDFVKLASNWHNGASKTVLNATIHPNKDSITSSNDRNKVDIMTALKARFQNNRKKDEVNMSHENASPVGCAKRVKSSRMKEKLCKEVPENCTPHKEVKPTANTAPKHKTQPVIQQEVHKPQLKSNLKTHELAKPNIKNVLLQRIKNAKLTQKVKNDSTSTSSNDEVQCECTDCDAFLNCPAWCKNHVDFEKPESFKSSIPLLKNATLEKPLSLPSKIDNKIILQGENIPIQMFALSETYIDERIQTVLKDMNCTAANHMQSYIWPTVQRGLSAFLIGPKQCGKTFGYLPIFTTFCIEKEDRYSELNQYDGPLAIILCLDNESCFDTHNLIKTMLPHDSNARVEVMTTNSSICECDMLVTTPAILEQSVKMGMVKLKRLCHLAIEDAQLVLRSHHKSLGTLLKVINVMQINRPHHKNIQLVVTSEKWSVDLETLLKRLYMPPLVCFEDFLEAAVYSKIQFRKKEFKTIQKIFYLIDVLKRNYMTEKSVVFCREEDMAKMKEQLEISGVECIAISNSLSEDEMFENEETWSHLRPGQYKVLLTSDSTFNKTALVVDAVCLVHYYLPQDWLQFQKRFRCFSKNVKSPLDSGETGLQRNNILSSFIIIDELSSNQLFENFFEVLLRNSMKYLHL